MVLLDPCIHFYKSALICKKFFSRTANLISSSFSALWAIRLHSTSIERSDSNLFGISLNIGMAVLFSHYISAQRWDTVWTLFYVGTEQMSHLWPFLGIWKGPCLWPQFFAINQLIYVVFTFIPNSLSHSNPHMLKIMKSNYLTILLHNPLLKLCNQT